MKTSENYLAPLWEERPVRRAARLCVGPREDTAPTALRLRDHPSPRKARLTQPISAGGHHSRTRPRQAAVFWVLPGVTSGVCTHRLQRHCPNTEARLPRSPGGKPRATPHRGFSANQDMSNSYLERLLGVPEDFTHAAMKSVFCGSQLSRQASHLLLLIHLFLI